MNTVKFAVIGLGNIGPRHLAVLEQHHNARIVGICDIDREKCLKYSEIYDNVPYFTDYTELLRKTDSDVIDICTPHYLHAPMAIKTAMAGKHVLVEKPMSISTASAHEMIEAAKKQNVWLMVVKQNRYNVPVQLTQRVLDEGRLGRVFMAQCNVLWNRHDQYYTCSDWRGRKSLEGGALYTQVSHFIDLLIWWFGDVVSAKASVETKNHAVEIEDCGIAEVRFTSGVMGTLMWTTCVYRKNYEGSITIIGEKGTIKIGGEYLNRIEYWDVQDYPLPDDVKFIDKPNSYGKYQGTSSNHDKVINDVINVILNKKQNVVKGETGLKTVQAIELIYQHAGVIDAPPL
ncbi:MAG: Gfo/Idh/MocA family protein [Candidatus Xenobiia bacterium LiM19]